MNKGRQNRSGTRRSSAGRSSHESQIAGRSSRGSQLAEFGPAIVILVGVILVPLLDLVVIPVRWMLAQDIANESVRQLALCETFSGARSKLNAYPSLESKLQGLGGVTVKSIDMQMKITRTSDSQSFYAKSPGEIPANWLPLTDANSNIYSLDLLINSQMFPVILFPKIGIGIPGLNEPVAFAISASHEWENLGRDPNTKRFYLEE